MEEDVKLDLDGEDNTDDEEPQFGGDDSNV